MAMPNWLYQAGILQVPFFEALVFYGLLRLLLFFFLL